MDLDSKKEIRKEEQQETQKKAGKTDREKMKKGK